MKMSPTAKAFAVATLPACAVIAACSNHSDLGPANSINSTPAAFTLGSNPAAVPNANAKSSAVTVTGTNAPSAISITGGTYSVNGGAFTSAAGTVNSGDSIVVQVLSSATYGVANKATLTIGGVSSDYTVTTETQAQQTTAVQNQVKTVVVIYAENRSFDNLFSDFPGANGIPADSTKYAAQVDRDGKTVLATLPQTWGGVTANGQDATVTQAQSANLPNAPFAIETAFQAGSGGQTLTRNTVTRDLYHRFFENQMQINGGKLDSYVAWGDSGGLVMGRFATANQTALYKLAQQYVLADNFFEGAFGGSFLNHQYLICACAPTYTNADTAAAKPTIAQVNPVDSTKAAGFGNYTSSLTTASSSPASALTGPPVFALSGNIAPKDYFAMGDGFRAVNTMQPPYQPSGNAPASSDSTHLYADTSRATTLPPQTQTTIGDLLTAKSLTWTWYTGAWDQATASTTGSTYAQPPANSSSAPPPVAPTFQFHHQPFNYYTNVDPVAQTTARKAHLQDYNNLVSAAANGTLPAVAFYKPEGDVNQHPGYTNVSAGDNHIASVVAKLQASPQYANMVIVITYDEFGGQWDHVTPPKGDLLGPGTRIPAIIISPFARTGTVDHTQYDTASILRLITRTFGTTTLPGLTARDTALKAAGNPAMGDLVNALNL